MVIKDMTPGSALYVLIKGDTIQYAEGSVVNIGAPRQEVPQITASTPFGALPSPKTVIDITFSVNGTTYTEAISETSTMFQTNKTGAITLVASDKALVVQELRATKKNIDNYLLDVEKQKKRKKQCEELIASLDTEYREKQAMDARIKSLEESTTKTNELLEQLLKKMAK